ESFQRIRDVSVGKVSLVADTALLLSPATPPGQTAHAAMAFCRAAKDKTASVIAFNANPLGSAMSAGAKRGNESLPNLEDLVTRHVEAILEARPEVHMVFVPHDPRDPHNDRALLQRTYDSLSQEKKNRVFCAFEGISA